MNKICPKCKEFKDLSAFGKRSTGHSKDGLSYVCKKCLAKIMYQDRIINRERHRKHQLVFQNSPKGVYKILKRKIKFGGKKSFDLEQQEFIEWYEKSIKKCSYCKITQKEWNSLNNPYSKRYIRLTVDRKNSNIGYQINNIVLACFRCNIIKSDIITYEEMIEIGQKYIRPKWDREIAIRVS